MSRFFVNVYSIWAAFWFVFTFLLIFPFQFIFLQKEEWKPLAHRCNRVWAHLFFPLVGMPIRVRYEAGKPDKNRAYVFAANHFSYLDVASMMLIVDTYFAFLGKDVLKKAPLFGYMFSKLHIQVDRNDPKSRSKSLQRSYRALGSGRSMVIYPEGGIRTSNPPQMHPSFKDGAFRMAIREQVPLIPISLLNNYQLLPDKKNMRLHPGAVKAVIHAPIETTGMTDADVENLRQRVFDIIQKTLDEYTANPKNHQNEFKRLTVI